MTETDNPIEQVVTRFGSASALARQLGAGTSTVTDWVTKQSIPYRKIKEVIRAGERVYPQILLEPNDFFPSNFRRRP